MNSEFDPTRYRVTVQSVEEDGETFVKGTVAELPDVAVFGGNVGSVFDEILEVITRLRTMALEHGKAFPAPAASPDEFSGRVTLRVPKSLHARLDRCATLDHVSLNTWIVTALAEKVGEHCVDRRVIEVAKFAQMFTASENAGRGSVEVSEKAAPKRSIATVALSTYSH